MKSRVKRKLQNLAFGPEACFFSRYSESPGYFERKDCIGSSAASLFSNDASLVEALSPHLDFDKLAFMSGLILIAVLC